MCRKRCTNPVSSPSRSARACLGNKNENYTQGSSPRKWHSVTLAMAAGMTDDVWTTNKLLSSRASAAFLAQLRESAHLFPPDYLENRLAVFLPPGVPGGQVHFSVVRSQAGSMRIREYNTMKVLEKKAIIWSVLLFGASCESCGRPANRLAQDSQSLLGRIPCSLACTCVSMSPLS
jgi:hypothetical protein